MDEAAGLPETVRSAIEAFTAAAREVFAEDLVSVVLFGSAVEGRLRATSDVNIAVVLAKDEPARLEAIGGAYRLAHAAINLSALFILQSEIAAASDAFAVKFFDIAARHRVLFGPDVFAGITVEREAAKRRLRQVVINLTLRLRERLALAGPYADRLTLAAADAVGPLRASAALLLSLESGTTLTPREALAEVAKGCGKEAALAALVQVRSGGDVPEGGAAVAITDAIEIAGVIATRAERLP